MTCWHRCGARIMVDSRQSIHFSITALLAVILSGCDLLARRDGLFECRLYAPVVYRYYYDSKILSKISQGDTVINRKFSVEEVDDRVLWRDGEFISYSLDKKAMYLKETYQGYPFSSLNRSRRFKCKWK
jgi:hypothetical protein